MIKKLSLADGEMVQSLNALELGYDYSVEETTKKLEGLLQHQDHLLLGAYDASGVLVGYCHGMRYDCLYFPTLLNVMALVVRQEEQGKGYGRQLMMALEDEAQALGLSGIRINSGIGRKEAHDFYRAMGYHDKSDQKRFFKSII